MATNSLETLLPQLSKHLADQMGLHFPPERWPDLERGIRSATPELGFPDAQTCIRALVSSPPTRQQIEILAGHLTVGETYFFRDKACFNALREWVLPEWIERGRTGARHLRIWSAGCCSGEEPYSIAILLREMLPDLPSWQLSIVATDINRHFLKKAQTAVYGPWSFREAPAPLARTWFTAAPDGKMTLSPEIRRMVQFSYLNLGQDTYPALLNNTNALDLIVCRNVLMYFSPDQVRKTIDNFHRALVDGGWLIVGAAEASPDYWAAGFTRAIPGITGIMRKHAPAAIAASPAPAGGAAGAGPGAAAPLAIKPPPQAKACTPNTEPPREPSFQDAQELHLRGMYSQAAELLVKLIAVGGPAHPDVKAIGLLARTYANEGKLAAALDHCDRAIFVDKLSPVWHYLRATILQEQGATAEAMASLQRALYLDGQFVLGHFAMGTLLRQQGDDKAARRYLQNARLLLAQYHRNDVLPESDGITAGRLAEVIACMVEG